MAAIRNMRVICNICIIAQVLDMNVASKVSDCLCPVVKHGNNDLIAKDCLCQTLFMTFIYIHSVWIRLCGALPVASEHAFFALLICL